MFEKTTDELFNKLKTDSDIEKFLSDNKNEFTEPLHKYLSCLLKKNNLTKKNLYEKLCCEPSHVYHIFKGEKKPSRKFLLAMARIMNLNLEETQYLLRYGGYGILYPRNTWDAVIISAIEQNLQVDEMDDLLIKMGEEPILNQRLAVNR